MLPEINLFGSEVSSYGVFAAIGLLMMGITAFILARRYRILLEDILFGEIFMLIGAFLGAHLLYGITNIHNIIFYLNLYFTEKWDTHYFFDIIFKFMDGMVFYGGLLGAIGFGALYCKFRKLDLKNYSDCFAVGIPLFHCVARLGCFFAGCCYGIESPFGFTTTNGIIESGNNVSRFPVQLLESGVNLALFVVLLILFRKGNMKGKIIYLYLLFYGTARFFIEFLRGDEYRGIFLGVSTSQWISLVLIGISLLVLYKNKKGEKVNEKM